MRMFLLLVTIVVLLIVTNSPEKGFAEQQKESIIIEVEGDVKEHKRYFEANFPHVKVVQTYDLLFSGLALQGTNKQLAKIHTLSFIKAFHPVRTYEVAEYKLQPSLNTVFPDALHTTAFTGKGVKVGVIDTGIDYTHPDLRKNYVGGYDLVDLDDDPMETKTGEIGPPTMHGTHVAGIIAADGELKGVAPDAELYAYRALGPGGAGSSIQVIAALEQAVKDRVDIINLSLGNSINGPDYPTSVAVNKAVDLGVAVVIANGNDGPADWTVGSPATATKALSVGAYAKEQLRPFLYERQTDQMIQFNLMFGSQAWNLTRRTKVIKATNEFRDVRGNILLMERSEETFYELGKQAERAGAVALLIMNNELADLQGSIENDLDPVTIPVAAISKQAGELLIDQLDEGSLSIETVYEQMPEQMAPFSSRGPVTINWQIKPDLVAPGTNIISTVPGGYLELNGTSMAAPQITGAIAIMKEAHPNWTNEEIIGALKTTAQKLPTINEQQVDATDEGMGMVNLDAAIKAKTIIDQPLLSFGKIDSNKEVKQLEINLKNVTDNNQTYSFDIPKKSPGLTWKLPFTFTLAPNERKTIPIELAITTSLLDTDVYQENLILRSKDNQYELPYLFINKTADYPKAMGFDFSLKRFDQKTYEYHLYVTEQVKSLQVNIYDPDTYVFVRTILETNSVKLGQNEGTIKKRDLVEQGHYLALVMVQLENGEYDSFFTNILIE